MKKLEVKKILINKLKEEIKTLSELTERDIKDIVPNQHIRHMELGKWSVYGVGKLNTDRLQILHDDLGDDNYHHVFFVDRPDKRGNV